MTPRLMLDFMPLLSTRTRRSVVRIKREDIRVGEGFRQVRGKIEKVALLVVKVRVRSASEVMIIDLLASGLFSYSMEWRVIMLQKVRLR